MSLTWLNNILDHFNFYANFLCTVSTHLNRTIKRVSKSSHQPASTKEQKLVASDPKFSPRKPQRDRKLPRFVRVPDRPCLFMWSLKQATSLTISAPWGKTCIKNASTKILPVNSVHQRVFVVKWTEVKAWLPTRFCYRLMYIDLEEWLRLLKEVRYVEPCLLLRSLCSMGTSRDRFDAGHLTIETLVCLLSVATKLQSATRYARSQIGGLWE